MNKLLRGCGISAAGCLLASAVMVQPGGTVMAAPQKKVKWAVVLHGGAGVIERKSMSPDMDAAYRAGLKEALKAAEDVLSRGGSSLDAVEAAIKLLEENPLFNAGKGAVFTAVGKNELDAAVMDGSTLKAGAVAGVTRTKSPISLARAVMEKSPHVMLIGEGADEFAASVGLEQVEPSYFFYGAAVAEPDQGVEEGGVAAASEACRCSASADCSSTPA